MLHQNKDQVHQALENSPSWDGNQRARQHNLHAGPASSSARPNPKQTPAAQPKKSQHQNPKSRLSKPHDPEPPQPQQRNRPKSQPQSPVKPSLSPSINPAIQAKLQQAHNRVLGPSRGGGKAEEGPSRPGSAKAGARSGNKAATAAAAQPGKLHLSVTTQACMADAVLLHKQAWFCLSDKAAAAMQHSEADFVQHLSAFCTVVKQACHQQYSTFHCASSSPHKTQDAIACDAHAKLLQGI